MPTPYKMIADANGYDYKSMDARTDVVLTPNHHLDMIANGNRPVDCPGVRMLEQMASHPLKSVPFLALFYTFVDPKSSGGWTWKGSAGGSNFYGLLDPGADQKTEGECLHFVKNLYLLCRAPHPYGLGMKNQEIKIVTYEGAGQGFVATHDQTYLKLKPNVAPSPGYNGRPLYNWANHKVLHVPAASLYADPCYGTAWTSLGEMATYVTHLQRDGYERAQRDGRFYYFVERSPSELVTNSECKYRGPLTETEFELEMSRGRLSVT